MGGREGERREGGRGGREGGAEGGREGGRDYCYTYSNSLFNNNPLIPQYLNNNYLVDWVTTTI